MTEPALALQGAIVAAIKAIPTVAGNNVYDRVPGATDPFPRVTVGEGSSVPLMADCYDGTESAIQIDAWSRAIGYPEVKDMAADIRARFHNGTLVLSGHTLELMQVESVTYERDPDGLTSRARLILRAITQPTD